MAKYGEWIEVKWRGLTEEEKEICPQCCAWADFELPDDGEKILISSNNGKWIEIVTFSLEEGVGDEEGNDWFYDVEAWMPLPRGFVKEGEQK